MKHHDVIQSHYNWFDKSIFFVDLNDDTNFTELINFEEYFEFILFSSFLQGICFYIILLELNNLIFVYSGNEYDNVLFKITGTQWAVQGVMWT